MVHGVACGSVDQGAVGVVLSIVDEDGPDVDEDEKRNVRELLEREQEWKEVVWYGLSKSVEGVESVGCVRGGHDPFVMGLVQSLVYRRVVQTPVNPVNEEVGEQDEEGELECIVP